MVKKLQFILFRGNKPGFHFLKLAGLVVSFIIITSLFSSQNFFISNSVNRTAAVDWYALSELTQ